MAHHCQVCVSFATVLAGLFGLGGRVLLSCYYLYRAEGTKDPFSFPPTLSHRLCNVADPGDSLLLRFCILSITKVQLLLGVTVKLPLGGCKILSWAGYWETVLHMDLLLFPFCKQKMLCLLCLLQVNVWFYFAACLFCWHTAGERSPQPSAQHPRGAGSSVHSKGAKKGPSSGRTERCLLKLPPEGCSSLSGGAQLQSSVTLRGRVSCFV